MCSLCAISNSCIAAFPLWKENIHLDNPSELSLPADNLSITWSWSVELVNLCSFFLPSCSFNTERSHMQRAKYCSFLLEVLVKQNRHNCNLIWFYRQHGPILKHSISKLGQLMNLRTNWFLFQNRFWVESIWKIENRLHFSQIIYLPSSYIHLGTFPNVLVQHLNPTPILFQSP